MNNQLSPRSTFRTVVKDRIDYKYNIGMLTITQIPTKLTTISRLISVNTNQTTTYGNRNPVTTMWRG